MSLIYKRKSNGPTADCMAVTGLAGDFVFSSSLSSSSASGSWEVYTALFCLISCCYAGHFFRFMAKWTGHIHVSRIWYFRALLFLFLDFWFHLTTRLPITLVESMRFERIRWTPLDDFSTLLEVELFILPVSSFQQTSGNSSGLCDFSSGLPVSFHD